MRIAYVQFRPVFGDLEANRRAMKQLIARAAPADLVVLPELASSGYNFADEREAAATSERADGDTCAALAEACRERQLFAVCGLNEEEGGRRYNSAILVGPEGLVGVYRKCHLFARERQFFEPGDLGIPVFEVSAARVGILICFDWAFPECWTHLMLSRADVVAHPSNLVLPGKAQKAVPVMAMMHRYFVITANRVGQERDLRFTGGSLVAGPDGALLATASPDGEEVGRTEIDPEAARDKWMTPYNDLVGDRRPELFEQLSKRLTSEGARKRR